MNIKAARFISIIFSLFAILFLPVSAFANTTPYRVAGWVSTAGDTPYLNTDKCQQADDQYCSRPSALRNGILYFGSFGNLEDFGIPFKSIINKVNIRLKGKSSTSQNIQINNSRNNAMIAGSGSSFSCEVPYDWGFITLGSTNTLIEKNTAISGINYNSLPACLNMQNLDQESFTFSVWSSGWYGTTLWSADIDNFEISFDYTPPAITYEDPAPSDFNGSLWSWDKDSDHASKSAELSNVTSIASGRYHTLALKSDGTVWVWGDNAKGQIGNGTSGNSFTDPVQVKGPGGTGFLTDIKEISAGDYYSMALKNDNTVWIWGDNSDGLRGTGTGANDPANKLLYPAQVKINYNTFLTDVTAISAGTNHSLALKSDGTVISWGANTNAKVGHCEFVLPWDCDHARIPGPVPNLNNVKTIAAGSSHNLAIKNDGTVWGWGLSAYYLLGSSNLRLPWEGSPVVQVGGLSNITAVSIGGWYNVALDRDGHVYNWGDDAIHDPVKINNLDNAKIISAGYKLGLAIKDDGTVWQWWETNNRPVKIKNLTQVSAITVSNAYNPSLAVVGDVSIPEPFLDLPWNYDCKQAIDAELNAKCECQNIPDPDKKATCEKDKTILSFDKAVFKINSYFDHQYPLQNFYCCIESTLTYLGGDRESKDYKSHSGYDYGAPAGIKMYTPVLAAAAGWAEFEPESESKGGGNIIKIDHGNGYQTWYEHLDGDNLIVATGERKYVEKGQKIGEVGMTGNTDGPHIHLSVFKDINDSKSFGDDYPYGLVDPLGWDGKYIDPWTEYTQDPPNKPDKRYGAKSYNLYIKKAKPKIQTIPQTGGLLKIDDFLQILVPDNATDSAITLTQNYGPFETFEALGKTFESIVPSFFLETINSIGDKITTFFQPIEINYNYSEVDLSNIKEETLKLYYFNEDTNKWDALPSTINMQDKTVAAKTYHFSHFALMGEVKDKIPPTTEEVIHGDKGQDNWYRSKVTVELNGKDNEDGIGLEYTLYTLDNDNWKIYSDPLNFDQDGDYTVSYQSFDKAGNEGERKISTFHIDTLQPTASVSAERASDANGWYNQSVKFSFSGQDDDSGIDKCTASTEYKEPDSENATVEGNCTDKAGNIATASANFKYDSTAPILIAIASSKGKSYTSGSWTNGDVQVTFNCADNVSGVDTVSPPITISIEGKDQSATGSCTDKAGNKRDIKFTGINIDKTTPEAKISYDPSSFDSIFSGKDNLGSTTVAIDKAKILQLKYTISDQAGNKLVINTDKVKLGKQVALTIKNLQYNNNPVISIDPNVFFTLALTDAKNTVKQLDQYYTLKDDKKIFSSYSSLNNKTKIYTKAPGSSTYTTEEKPGIALLNLETEGGKLKYSY